MVIRISFQDSANARQSIILRRAESLYGRE
jgi:hypothetical protein